MYGFCWKFLLFYWASPAVLEGWSFILWNAGKNPHPNPTFKSVIGYKVIKELLLEFCLFVCFSLPLVIWSWWLLTWVICFQSKTHIMSWCLHSHITYITYWSLVCCCAFSYKIKSVTLGAWRTLEQKMSGKPHTY